MSDWDQDSNQVRLNLRLILSDIRDDPFLRTKPTVEAARKWQVELMRGLSTPDPKYVGRFRGEPGLEGYEVAVGSFEGVRSDLVAQALGSFEGTLQAGVAFLNKLAARRADLSADDVAAIIDLCAWAHAEWVRIHLFVNGNGRTARLWANAIAMHYRLPPFVRLRPRPGDGYGTACAAAMQADWQPTARVFRQMYRRAIQQ